MAIFQEGITNDAGESIAEAAGVVSIPKFDRIEGVQFDSGDVDFYELQLESNATVNVELFESNESLTLFNARGNLLDTSDNSVLNFSGKAGETFFLKLGEEAEITTPALDDYEIALNVVNTSIFDDLADLINDLYVFGTENDNTLTGSSKNEILVGYAG